MKSELPSPYDYLDYRRYLSEWFRAKKAANPRYSHRAFIRRAGQKSPSLLHHVIEGRRNLTAATQEGFIVALSLRAGEAQFFRGLVALDQASDTQERNVAWQNIASTRRFREARRQEWGSFEYLSNWTLPAIRELAARSDFQVDPAWIAAQLRPQIKTAEAKRALKVLVDLGLLVADEQGGLVPADVSLATPTEVAGLAVQNYHQGMLALAGESIERFPGEQRHLLAVTVGVPESLMPQLKAEANAFMERMMHLCDASEADDDRVMQLNLQLFPLTASRQEPE